LQPAYTHLVDIEETMHRFPISKKVTTDTFFLGTSPVITKEQLDYVGEVVDTFMKQF